MFPINERFDVDNRFLVDEQFLDDKTLGNIKIIIKKEHLKDLIEED